MAITRKGRVRTLSGSRILTIQSQHAELFRIRLGHKEGNRPAKLTGEIRVTSPNRKVVEAFAAVYGGRAKKWEKQHEVYLPITRLPVMFLPGQTLDQTMELWAGSTRSRCCNGETMCGGGPCACALEGEVVCKPTSRLTVACPAVPVVGVGKLVTHSAIAAGELDASISLIQGILDQGKAVPGVLRIDSLVGPERRYNVPRIEIEGLTFADLALASGVSQPALGAGGSMLALEGGDTDGEPQETQPE